MSDIPRMTITELLARYELEPELADVFVEGEFDKDVLARCVRESGRSGVIVYDIGSVEITAVQLGDEGLTEGNKQRVIALARYLGSIDKDCSYRCIVDRDLDHWFGELEATPRLRWTAYTALELYFFSEEFLRDILISTTKSRIVDWSAFYSSFVVALRELYAFRLADRDLGWSMQWISFDRCLRVVGSAVELDSREYTKRLLMKNNKAGFVERFAQKASEWDGRLIADPRLSTRGHDFVDLLAWTVRRFGGVKQFAEAIALERLFVLMAGKALGLLALLD